MDDSFLNWINEHDVKMSPLWSEMEYLTKELSNKDESEKRPFFGKVTVSNLEGLTISITNFIHLWIEEINMKDFEKRLKDLNPNLEADAKTMMKEIRETVLGRRRECKITVDERSDGKNIKIGFATKFDRLPLKWQCQLEMANAKEFNMQIVTPLLTTVFHYQRRESVLFDMITTKDQEIEQKRLISRNSSRDQRGNDVEKFRSREWSGNDLQSKDFIKAQRHLRSDTVTRSIISNELFASVCRADDYIRENADSPNVEENQISFDNAESDRLSPSGNRNNELDSSSDQSTSKQSPAKTDAVARRTPTPPPPSTTPPRKQKRLRL